MRNFLLWTLTQGRWEILKPPPSPKVGPLALTVLTEIPQQLWESHMQIALKKTAHSIESNLYKKHTRHLNKLLTQVKDTMEGNFHSCKNIICMKNWSIKENNGLLPPRKMVEEHVWRHYDIFEVFPIHYISFKIVFPVVNLPAFP